MLTGWMPETSQNGLECVLIQHSRGAELRAPTTAALTYVAPMVYTEVYTSVSS
jgi:hypothetical protein